MNKNTTKYRDLDPEDIHEAGDEFKGNAGRWIDAINYSGQLVGIYHRCRRPIPETESPWIPISSPPTEEDADDNGRVFFLYPNGGAASFNWQNLQGLNYSHWMPIPPLPEPEPEPTKAEALLERMVEMYSESGNRFTEKQKYVIATILNAEEAE
tara:strand:+ start:954 stop:1415 length:462 start_codon:yes stop_codon:yes gene_type:complete